MSNVHTSFVDSATGISDLLDAVALLWTDPPSIFIDLEGSNVSRNGSISLLVLLLDTRAPQKHVYLIDVFKLGATAFDTLGKNGKTLRDVLQSPSVPKVFFDVRNDSDALHTHFNISLQGVEDVQLMEVGSRQHAGKKFLNSLAKSIEFGAVIDHPSTGPRMMSELEKQDWKATKEKAEALFRPQDGGSGKVFNARPLAEEIVASCVGNVLHLPGLRDRDYAKLSPEWKGKVAQETEARVVESQRPHYFPHGPFRAHSPWQNESLPARDDHTDDPELRYVW